MRHRVAVAVVVGIAVLASALALWREHLQGRLDQTGSRDSPVNPAPIIVAETALPADSSAARGEQAATELRGKSQTFRNSTFLVAIRGAGFYCDDVVSADESAAGVWLASCADKRGYTISVLEIGGFDVRPVPHYFDSLDSSQPNPNQFQLDR
jgi:hypothetical protein